MEEEDCRAWSASQVYTYTPRGRCLSYEQEHCLERKKKNEEGASSGLSLGHYNGSSKQALATNLDRRRLVAIPLEIPHIEFIYLYKISCSFFWFFI